MRRTTTMYNMGYYIALFGAAIILLWIGLFKFTPSEAQAIKPLVENHPLSFWVYNVLSVQTVSNIIGIIEIMTALGLVATIFAPSISRYVGFAMVITFLTTLSYLFTTPNMWNVVDGIYTTDFFILKDLVLLGFGFMLIGRKKEEKTI